MTSREISVFGANKVRIERSDTSEQLALEMQAVMATEVLSRLIGSGVVSGDRVVDEVNQMQETFLRSDPFLMMVSPTGRPEERDRNVRAIGEAAAFLTTVVKKTRTPSRMSKIGARLGGIFK